MKKILTATVLALVLSTSVMASPSQSDMNQVFSNQETISDVSQLSSQEMIETQGDGWKWDLVKKIAKYMSIQAAIEYVFG